MSNAGLFVRFDDGLLLFGQYHGTSDTCHSGLFMSYEEAWTQNRRSVEGGINLSRTCECPGEPVELCDDYGGSKYWPGAACRIHLCLCDGGAPFDTDGLKYQRGEPQWLKDFRLSLEDRK